MPMRASSVPAPTICGCGMRGCLTPQQADAELSTPCQPTAPLRLRQQAGGENGVGKHMRGPIERLPKA